jgi:hypothetical protein
MIVALCVAVFVLFAALYLSCCPWQHARLVLAILFTLFDVFILLAAICIFALRGTVLTEIGYIMSDESQSAIVIWFEEQFDCCGFNEHPSHDCGSRTQNCYNVLDAKLQASSGAIGGILIAIFVVLLVAVVYSYIRVFKKPGALSTPGQSKELAEIQERLATQHSVWF